MRKTGMGTTGYAISSQTKDPAAAWKLLQYTFTDGMKVFMESYLIGSADQDLLRRSGLAGSAGPPYNNDIFVDAIDDAMLPPPLPFYSTGPFRKAMLDGIDAVLLGQMDAEAA